MKTVLTILAVIAVVVGAIGGWFWWEFGASIREARQKEAAFRALGPAKFEKLIELASEIGKKEDSVDVHRFGGYKEPAVPSEFSAFGFDRLEIRSGIVEGRVYWLVDSGGFARIDTRAMPFRLLFVRGDHGDIIDVLYEKKTPNQSLQPTTMSVTDRAFARSAPATVVADL